MQEQEKLHADINSELKKNEADYGIAIARLVFTLLFNLGIQIETLLDAFDTPLLHRPFHFLLWACILHCAIFYISMPVVFQVKFGMQSKFEAICTTLLTIFMLGLVRLLVFVAEFNPPFACVNIFAGALFLIYDIRQVILFISNKKKLLNLEQAHLQKSILKLETKLAKNKTGNLILKLMLALVLYMMLMVNHSFAVVLFKSVFILALLLGIGYITAKSPTLVDDDPLLGAVMGLGVAFIALIPLFIGVLTIIYWPEEYYINTVTITGLLLVAYDIYRIISFPVYKKKLHAMQEQYIAMQYEQSIFLIEYE